MAVWDPFLTDQDREHLKLWGKTELNGFGSKPALLVIDDYYSVVGHERKPILESIKDWPMSCGLEGWAAIDKTATLLSIARGCGVPVVYARGLDGFPSPWARPRSGQSRRMDLSNLPPEIRAMGNEIIAEVAPLPGELVIEKAAASAFQGTPLMFHLTALGVDTVIVVGETTSGCVRATVVDAATYRLRVGIVEECCFDRTQAAHAINLFDMHQKYGDVIDIPQAEEYFRSLRVPERTPALV